MHDNYGKNLQLKLHTQNELTFYFWTNTEMFSALLWLFKNNSKAFASNQYARHHIHRSNMKMKYYYSWFRFVIYHIVNFLSLNYS